jgi:plasmid stabilization system protein ParE
MPSITWSPRALKDLDRLYTFVAKHDRSAGLRAIESIRIGIRQLAVLPHLGKPAGKTGERQIIIPFGAAAYRVFYSLSNDSVRIDAIYHSREESR